MKHQNQIKLCEWRNDWFSSPEGHASQEITHHHSGDEKACGRTTDPALTQLSSLTEV